MIRRLACVALVLILASCQRHKPAGSRLSVCELAADFGAYRGQTIAVRGVYHYFSLRQTCEQKCSDGPRPSYVDLSGGDRADWDLLAKAQDKALEFTRKTGKHVEIWVTVKGRLYAADGDPCDWKRGEGPGYGHLNAYPAEIGVAGFSEIELVENEGSPLSYGYAPPGR